MALFLGIKKQSSTIDVYTCNNVKQLIKMKKILFLLGIAAIFTACNSANSSKAGEEQEVANATEGSVTYKVSATESTVQWFGEKITGWSHKGLVGIQQGSFNVENKRITAGEFVIDMNSLSEVESVMDEKKQSDLIEHLKSPDFFNVDSFPTANFAVVSADENNVTANLTIKGITKSITLPYNFHVDGDKAHITAEFTINRADWNVRYGSGTFFENLGDDLIKDDIKFKVSLVATK